MSWDVPFQTSVLMAGATYLPFLWSRGRTDWNFFYVLGFLESEVWINPLKCKIQAIGEMCKKKENFRLFPGAVRSAVFMVKYTWVRGLMEYLLTKKRDPFMHSFSTTAADSGIPNWGERKDKIITVVWNLTFVNKLITFPCSNTRGCGNCYTTWQG